MEEAEKIAQDIMSCSPLAIKAIKEMSIDGIDMPLKEANKNQFPSIFEFYKSQDFIEGPKAFTEKRKPKWQGV
jgi:enoyl-CoA hydratase/carnithine racemase